jgi:methyltransferase (TIGR00027 family)
VIHHILDAEIIEHGEDWMTVDKISRLSRTAIGVTWLRRREEEQESPLFRDPYAAMFLRAAREVVARDMVRAGRTDSASEIFGLHVVLRTRFYDDYLLEATAKGIRQVVLVAAGLDSRAFRLEWPKGVRLFELDLPELLEFKEGVLADHRVTPRCARTVLPVDLREDWPARLAEHGFDPAQPTAWLIEGLLIYLTAAEAATLLTRLDGISAPGSQLSCEHRDNAANSILRKARASREMDEVTALWKGGLGEDQAGWLDRAGWAVRTHDGGALAQRYHRPHPDADSVAFLTAVKEG